MANSKPNLVIDITKKIEKPGGGKPYWAPVGRMSLWKGDDGRFSGKLRLNIFGDAEFNCFENDGSKPDAKQPATQDDIPF